MTDQDDDKCPLDFIMDHLEMAQTELGAATAWLWDWGGVTANLIAESCEIGLQIINKAIEDIRLEER